ncbi:MAG: PQQ-like beta-propeller repeat protein [SAR202 cluster bacterium]|jgi:outer membrane protein assembly factor BamB|nr:PQQ-like beta-propeller repeat protein [SAR202 cluster bacterium]
MRLLLNSVILLFLLTRMSVVWADEWPQWRGPQRDGVWRETGIVEQLPKKLAYRWRVPIGGGFSGPAVVGDRVYVTDRIAPVDDLATQNEPFSGKLIRGGERILCLDADTGRIIWQHSYPCPYNVSYPAGPRTTPTVHEGKVYSLGTMGDLLCLDAASGDLLWKKNYVADFGTEMNAWGMAAAPLVDGQQLVLLVGGKDNACVVALDKDSGQEIWRSLNSVDPGYSAPVIIRAGGRRQLIVWNPVGLYGLNPETGAVYWQQLDDLRMGHSVATPIFDASRRWLFVTSFFDGPTMMQLGTQQPTASLLWKGDSRSELPNNTDGLHSVISTPVFQDGFIYGICSYGQLRCLEAGTGKRVWETDAVTPKGRWATAHLVRHGDRYVIFNEKGELIFAQFSPQGYKELSRTSLIEPTLPVGRREVVWSHPAFAHRCVFVRNDREIVCVDLSGSSAVRE